MSALDIPPHPHSDSRLAVAMLGVLAAGALATGYLRQVVAMQPDPPPAAGRVATAPIAEATPAPEPMLQVAEAPPPRRSHAADDAPLVDVPPVEPTDSAAAAAAAAPAADTSALAPAQPEPPGEAPTAGVAPTDPGAAAEKP